MFVLSNLTQCLQNDFCPSPKEPTQKHPKEKHTSVVRHSLHSIFIKKYEKAKTTHMLMTKS